MYFKNPSQECFLQISINTFHAQEKKIQSWWMNLDEIWVFCDPWTRPLGQLCFCGLEDRRCQSVSPSPVMLFLYFITTCSLSHIQPNDDWTSNWENSVLLCMPWTIYSRLKRPLWLLIDSLNGNFIMCGLLSAAYVNTSPDRSSRLPKRPRQRIKGKRFCFCEEVLDQLFLCLLLKLFSRCYKKISRKNVSGIRCSIIVRRHQEKWFPNASDGSCNIFPEVVFTSDSSRKWRCVWDSSLRCIKSMHCFIQNSVA